METHTPPVALEGLSLDALAGLQAQVDTEIKRKRRARQVRALEEIAKLVTKAELSPEAVLSHLEGRSRKTNRRTSSLPPKYRDPYSPENTWAGRGKRPKWLEAKLAKGAKLEEFRIGSQATMAGSTSAAALSPSHRDGKQAITGDNQTGEVRGAPSTLGSA